MAVEDEFAPHVINLGERASGSKPNEHNVESQSLRVTPQNLAVGSKLEIRRPQGRDKAKAAGEKRGSKSSASASSSVNEDALARLMVTEMGAQEKEERLAFLEIKMREVECRE
ncbi:hypothetical protein Tco_1453468 [Tanacetum coccineum]